jgi:hypothetical protein
MIAISDVVGKPPTESVFFEKYSRIACVIDEVLNEVGTGTVSCTGMRFEALVVICTGGQGGGAPIDLVDCWRIACEIPEVLNGVGTVNCTGSGCEALAFVCAGGGGTDLVDC